MIDWQEILEFAGEVGLDANVVAKHYVLGWMLAGISEHPRTRDTWPTSPGSSCPTARVPWKSTSILGQQVGTGPRRPGMTGLVPVVIPHPLSSLTDEEIRARAANALPEVVAAWQGKPAP